MSRGSIETLRTGFRARVYAGKDPITGKQTYLRGETRRHRRDAETDAERLVANVEAERRPDQHATVAHLLDRWTEVVDHELSTAETTAGYVRRTLKPALGDLPVRKLQHRVDILDRLYTHLRRCSQLCDGQGRTRQPEGGADAAPHVCRPMSPSSVRRVHAILSAALNYAVSWGWIERNPADYAHPPKIARRRAEPPTPEQVALLLNAAAAADDEVAVFLWLAVTTGARRGELVALRWSALDLDRGTLRLFANYVVRSGQRQLKGTKTGEERLLSLDAATVGALADLRAVRADALAPAGLPLPADAFVFTPDPLGARPWNPDHFTHRYRALADELGIVEPLKNLRHFNATQLLAAGVDLRTTAGRLGHSDGGATTLRVYASWTRPADQRAAELLAGDLAALRALPAATPLSHSAAPARRRTARVRPELDDVLPLSGELRDYRQLAAALRDAIRLNKLRPGDLCPSAAALAAHVGLARSTAHRTITALGDEGAIVRVRGRWEVAGSALSRRKAEV